MAKDIGILTDEISKGTMEIALRAKAVRDDYSYFDNMPLEGWAWEFIRRNSNYNALYGEIENYFRTIYKAEDNTLKSPIFTSYLYRIVEEFGITVRLLSTKPDDADNFMNIDKLDFLVEIPNPKIKYSQFRGMTPKIEGATALKYYLLSDDEKKYLSNMPVPPPLEFVQFYHRVMRMGLTPVNPSKTLYIGLDLNANVEDIKKQLNSILETYYSRATKRKHDKKWKYYVIVHDLINEGRKYANIAEVLMTAYEKDKNRLNDEKNMENYHRSAIALINGGYKEYLHLEK